MLKLNVFRLASWPIIWKGHFMGTDHNVYAAGACACYKGKSEKQTDGKGADRIKIFKMLSLRFWKSELWNSLRPAYSGRGNSVSVDFQTGVPLLKSNIIAIKPPKHALSVGIDFLLFRKGLVLPMYFTNWVDLKFANSCFIFKLCRGFCW